LVSGTQKLFANALTLLIGNRATGLTGGLTGSLALAASNTGSADGLGRFVYDLNVFHSE
jgi:hypothetical protein